MPRGGGKGGTLLRARSFKLRLERDRFFFYRKFLESRRNWRRAKSVTLQRLLLAETGRTQSGRSGELLCFFAVLPAVPGATGLPVLALLLALLSQYLRALLLALLPASFPVYANSLGANEAKRSAAE